MVSGGAEGEGARTSVLDGMIVVLTFGLVVPAAVGMFGPWVGLDVVMPVRTQACFGVWGLACLPALAYWIRTRSRGALGFVLAWLVFRCLIDVTPPMPDAMHHDERVRPPVIWLTNCATVLLLAMTAVRFGQASVRVSRETEGSK